MMTLSNYPRPIATTPRPGGGVGARAISVSRHFVGIVGLVGMLGGLVGMLGGGTASPADQSRWSLKADRFPSVWFGANVSGPDAPHLVQNHVVNYSSAYFGWQTMNGVSGCRHEESLLREQTAAVKALAPNVITLAYAGNGASLLDFYDAQHELIANPERYAGFFLHAPPTAAVDPAAGPRGALTDCPLSKLTWDFRNASAVDYWVEHVAGQWVDDNVTDAIFVDEGDSVVCIGHPDLPTLADRFAWSNGSFVAYRRAAELLAGRGKRLVLSLKNGFAGHGPITFKFPVCPVPMDEVIKAMHGVPLIRFHEYWGAVSKLKAGTDLVDFGAWGQVDGATMCNNLITTGILEAKAEHLAFSAHAGDYWRVYNRVQKTNLDLTFAMFMVARNGTVGAAADFFGWSTGDFWYSSDWHWSDTAALYQGQYGQPVGAVTQSGQVYSRAYEHAKFTVDCATLTSTMSVRD